MDPITILAAATAAFNGVKKAVELGREVQDIYGQLSDWAGHVGEFHRAVVAAERPKKPGIFDKITFAKSETAEAFDVYAAKQKVIEMEKEIYHMFCYGELQHLGQDGYNEFRKMRQEIREKRDRMIITQMEDRAKFFENIKVYGLSAVIIIFGSGIIWVMISLIYETGHTAGKW
jgi:hypothetical protein